MQAPIDPIRQPALNRIKYHELPIAMQFGIFVEYSYGLQEQFDCYIANTSNEDNLYDETTITIRNTLSFVEGRL